MPNWVTNELIINGSEKEKSRFLDTVKSDQHDFDLQKIEPMPATLHLKETSLLTNGIEFVKRLNEGKKRSTALMETFGTTKENEKERMSERLGRIAYYNKERYGHYSWLNWRREHWGCKWNVETSEVNDNVFSFETPWTAPYPIIKKLADMFPELSFRYSWADEDCGYNCGQIDISNGIVTEVDMVEGSDEAIYFAEAMWGEHDF